MDDYAESHAIKSLQYDNGDLVYLLCNKISLHIYFTAEHMGVQYAILYPGLVQDS